jgi:pectate lyase
MRQTGLTKVLLIAGLIVCMSLQQPGIPVAEERALAFPGAEGFGQYTTGGRGGGVMIVSNLNDHGAGSFRQAAESAGARMIMFAISGTIHLESPLVINANVTIAGQTAPGDGICIADHPVSLGGNNIIVRYLRFRMGDKYQNKGMVNGSGGDDAFGGTRRSHIIIDHCSFSWSTDECFSVYSGDSTTLQWNIISEPLNYSYHFETGDTDWERHGYGGIWGGKHLSAHHNLFAHCVSRNPRFNGVRMGTVDELVDYRNNVIYNWGGNNVYGGEGGKYNMVNNYYRYGPSTNQSIRFQVVNPGKQANPLINFGKFFVNGNYVDGSDTISKNNLLGVYLGNNASAEDKEQAVMKNAFDVSAVSTQKAADAYALVLSGSGASFQRDTLDQRIVNDVKNRTGRIIDVQGGFAHGTPYEQTVNAWPGLRSVPAPKDGDSDGMPDSWELKNKLDPKKANAAGYDLNKLYTNIEVYINSITDNAKQN